MLNRVVEDLNLSMGAKELSKNISIKPVEDTSIISVTVKDPNAARFDCERNRENLFGRSNEDF